MMRKAADRTLSHRTPIAPISMGAQVRAVRSHAETALRVLLRLIAMVWLIEGAEQWAGVLTSPDLSYLPAMPPLHVAGLFFFCILDAVAAVGLWLVSSWGVAVWLATILGHALALALAPGFLAQPLLIGASDAVLVIAYAGLAWTVAREHHLA